MDIGKRLRELRLARGISESDLEMRTGIPGAHLNAVEEGTQKPTLDILETLARELGVEMHELFLADSHTLSPPQRQGIGKLSRREEELIWILRSLPLADQRDLLFIGKKMVSHGLKKEGG